MYFTLIKDGSIRIERACITVKFLDKERSSRMCMTTKGTKKQMQQKT